MNNVIAIGDIHGKDKVLAKLLKEISGQFRSYVFLGDYIDRGKGSKKTIDLLIDFSMYNDCHFIKGNHEELFLKYLNDADIISYARVGGLETIYSYLKKNATGEIHSKFLNSLPLEHIQFFDQLIDSYKIQNFVFIHNINKLPTLKKKYIYIHGHGLNNHEVLHNKTICLNVDTDSNKIATYQLETDFHTDKKYIAQELLHL